jgi:hypothetical protein
MSTDAFTLASGALKEAVERAIGGTAAVVLTDPGQGNGSRVSVWLYQAGIDEFGRNAAPPTADDQTANRRRAALPPLGVNLHYLITPIFDRPEADQQALARVMLGLYEEPVLRVFEPEAGVYDQVRVSPVPDPLDDRARLWEALGKPYRLCACYLVRAVRLASLKTVPAAPVAAVAAGRPGGPPPRG